MARERSARECSIASREYADILKYLWQQLEAREPLSVEVLAGAHRQEAFCRTRLACVEDAHRRDCERVVQLEEQIVRLDKDLEKLEERRLARREQARVEHQTAESRALDEWVLGRHGRGAAT